MHRATVYRWAAVAWVRGRPASALSSAGTRNAQHCGSAKFFRQLAAAKTNGKANAAPLKKHMKLRIEAELAARRGSREGDVFSQQGGCSGTVTTA